MVQSRLQYIPKTPASMHLQTDCCFCMLSLFLLKILFLSLSLARPCLFTHSQSHSHHHSAFVATCMMRSTEFKTSRYILMLFLLFSLACSACSFSLGCSCGCSLSIYLLIYCSWSTYVSLGQVGNSRVSPIQRLSALPYSD